MQPIYDITPFTFLDYPDKTACILWFTGCNMRCGYCYNPDIVKGKGRYSIQQALEFIDSRKHLLEGVVLSGGECTLHRCILPLSAAIRHMGLMVKIDTNGSNPGMLQELLRDGAADFVALDFKAPREKFHAITKSALFGAFDRSLSILLDATVRFEVRTTVHPQLLDHTDLAAMISYLEQKGYRGTYYIQHFVNDTPTLDRLANAGPYPDFLELSTPLIKVQLRTG